MAGKVRRRACELAPLMSFRRASEVRAQEPAFWPCYQIACYTPFAVRSPINIALLALGVALVPLSIRAQNQSAQPQDTPPAGVEKVGGKVSAPRVIYDPNPEFSEQARRAGYQGTCTVGLIVERDGTVSHVHMIHSLGMGLDEQALAAVKTWRFEPARKDGEPVPVQILVEVDFSLYGGKATKLADAIKKANSGDANAELEVSNLYFVAGVQQQGMRFLERAANHGLAKAQFLMAERKVAGTAPDYPAAYMWYTLAARGGYKKSQKPLKELTSKMSTEQVAAGKELMDKWSPAPRQ